LEQISALKALYIKLGKGGEWEAACLQEGLLRYGDREIPHEVCMAKDWVEVKRLARLSRKNEGAATSQVNQLRQFYETPKDFLWITFHSDRLWWCFSETDVRPTLDNDKVRDVSGSWHDEDINGVPLIKGRLSGKLLAVQGYRGTICAVPDIGYLIHKINGTVQPHVAVAKSALEKLAAAITPIIQGLHQNDLEILTDLIFRQSGWQRVGVAGGTEKDIDLDLISSITQDRIAVQIKSRATIDIYRAYREKFADMRGFTRFYFVTHSPDDGLREKAKATDDASFVFWGPEEITQLALRNGLTGWLFDKAG
jgi:hypothetical protein